MTLGQFQEQFRGAQFLEPEPDLWRFGVLLVLEIVCLDQTTDHRPILVALGLLGLDQVGQGEEVDFFTAGQLKCGPPSPQSGEGIHPAHSGHNINAHV